MKKAMLMAAAVMGIIGTSFPAEAVRQNSRYSHADERFSFQPPEGWTESKSGGATAVKFSSAPEGGSRSLMDVIVTRTSMVTPLSEFIRQLKEHQKRKFKDLKIYQEKELTVHGRNGYQIIIEVTEPEKGRALAFLQTVVQRGWLTFYSIDMVCERKNLDHVLGLYAKVIESFRFDEWALNDREKKAWGNWVALLENLKGIQPELLGEEWYSILYKDKPVGYFHTRVEEGTLDKRKGYMLLTDLYQSTEPGVYSHVRTQGFFSEDFTYQKLERREEIDPKDKEKMVHQYWSELHDGRVQIRREIRGQKEEKTLHVDRHVFLRDVAEVARKLLIASPHKEALVQDLFLTEEIMSIELWENVGKEKLKFDDHVTEMNVMFVTRDRRSKMHAWYDPQRRLKKEYIPEAPIVMKAATREAATRGFDVPK